MALTDEELKKLRERQQSAKGIELTPLTTNEQNLHAESQSFFSADSDESKKPLSPEKSKEPLEETANQSQEGSLSKKLSAFFPTLTLEEKLHSYFSSEEGRTQVKKMRALREIIYPNEIKLNGKENLVDQLKEKGVDLDLFDEEIRKLARPLNRDNPHYVKIMLKNDIFLTQNDRFLTLDIFQYERDKAQREAPPPGPQKSNQEQPALGPIKGILRKSAPDYFAGRNSENQEGSFEKNTPHAIPNLLPELLTKSETAIKASNKQPFAEGPPLGQQESNQKQPVAEGPQESNQKQHVEGEKPNAHQKKGVTWATKMVEERFIPGRKCPGR